MEKYEALLDLIQRISVDDIDRQKLQTRVTDLRHGYGTINNDLTKAVIRTEVYAEFINRFIDNATRKDY